MSRLQKNKFDFITNVMDSVSLDYHPATMKIKKKDLIESLLNLKTFVKSKEKLWYTIIDDSEIDENWISENIKDLKF